MKKRQLSECVYSVAKDDSLLCTVFIEWKVKYFCSVSLKEKFTIIVPSKKKTFVKLFLCSWEMGVRWDCVDFQMHFSFRVHLLPAVRVCTPMFHCPVIPK